MQFGCLSGCQILLNFLYDFLMSFILVPGFNPNIDNNLLRYHSPLNFLLIHLIHIYIEKLSLLLLKLLSILLICFSSLFA